MCMQRGGPVVDRARLEHPPLYIQADSGRGGQSLKVCWVGTGHCRTRPGAFVIKIVFALHSRLWGCTNISLH